MGSSEGGSVAALGNHWLYKTDTVLTARWRASSGGGNFNNFESGKEGIVNAVVEPSVITNGAIVVTFEAYGKDVYFCVDDIDSAVKTAEGVKYVFEAEFTYVGGAATGQGLAFVGFTRSAQTGLGNGEMYKSAYLKSSEKAASDGYAESVELYGVTYERGVTYKVRYEFVPDDGTVSVYTNGKLVTVHTPPYTQAGIDPRMVYAFQYYIRLQGAGCVVKFDNVYCGMESK